MGFLDDAKKKLTGAVDAHGDKIASGLDKAGEFVNKKTGGKYSEKIEGGLGKAKDALDKLDGKDDDIADDAAPDPVSEPATPDIEANAEDPSAEPSA